MQEKNELIVSLLYKSTEGQPLTETEKYELEQWLSLSEYNTILYDEVMDLPGMVKEIKSTLRNYDSDAQWKKIRAQIKNAPLIMD
jgi:hypothetical protein